MRRRGKRPELHFNPRSPHGERLDAAGFFWSGRMHFNPRSPHGERLSTVSATTHASTHFNPRSPHGERRLIVAIPSGHFLFQSTLPARGATAQHPDTPAEGTFQSTLPARGATAEGTNEAAEWRFQSTLPARGATGIFWNLVIAVSISIHAPRTGSDVNPAD